MSDPSMLLMEQEDEVSDKDEEMDAEVSQANAGGEMDEEEEEDEKFSLFEDDEEDEEDEDQNQVVPIPVSAETKIPAQAPESTGAESGGLTTRATSSANPELLTDMASFASVIPNISDRFRNALARVQSSATTDVEAWQALLNEAQMSFRSEYNNLQQWLEQARVYGTANTPSRQLDFAKFDLLESIYGALLQTFPLSGTHYAGVAEMLILLSSSEHSSQPSSETNYLPVIEDLSTLLPPSVAMELTRRRHIADRKATHVFQVALGVNMDGSPYLGDEDDNNNTASSLEKNPSSSLTPRYLVRAGMCSSHVPLWTLYIQKATRDVQRHLSITHAQGAPRELMYTDTDARSALISAFEATITHAGFVTGCHTLWRNYVNYLNASFQCAMDPQTRHKQMLHLRRVYQRLIGTPMMNLEQEFWREYEALEQSQSEALAQALIAEHLPRMQHAKQVYMDRLAYASADTAGGVLHLGRLPTPPASVENEPGMAMERTMWMAWQKRLLFERSNPERLPSTSDLTLRIRQVYKEAVCVMMRHPEVWHEWASWEARGHAGGGREVACQVLEFATSTSRPLLLRDCALLSASLAEILEEAGEYSAAIACLEGYVHRSPCSLGFILLQRLVRRTQGIQAARLVFSRARKSLKDPHQPSANTGGPTDTHDHDVSTTNGTAAADLIENSLNGSINTFNGVSHAGAAMNNGITMTRIKRKTKPKSALISQMPSAEPETVGIMTWHLFASHAHMEFRNNKCPEVAARVFELGLTKHRSFLTCPSYVLAYSRLLLERGEDDNLRSLLERSIAACEEAGEAVSKHGQNRLWDMLLEFECLHSRGCGDPKVIRNVETRRRRALAIEDPVEDAMPKSIVDQLNRSDGENAGLIIGGLGRLVQRYELIGILGDGHDGADLGMAIQENFNEYSMLFGARRSDASFSLRHHGLFRSDGAGVASTLAFLDKTRPSAARDRLPLTGTQPAAAALGLINQSACPDWLKPLVAVLPVPRFQRFNVKPPPHMIELALTSLRSSSLPPRPTGADALARESTISGKRLRAENGDSSDEDEVLGVGGYSNQFRIRQRARQATTLGT